MDGSVIVITGAASGIGRATALAFAERADTLVLVSRRREALEDLVRRCEDLGRRAVAVDIDVTDAAAVEALARDVVERFGRIDVWVNNAAVMHFTRFGEEPVEEFARVIETNLMGYVHGARAVLPWFRDRGRGVLINVGSVLSRLPSPYLASYVMSKHAVRALSACLRTELLDASGVRVCTVMPGSVDTPIFQHAANRTGWGVRALPPVSAPERAARAIVACARRPRDEMVVGIAPRLAVLQHALFRRLSERATARTVRRGHFTDRPAPPTTGNLLHPVHGWETAAGGWRGGTGVVARRVAVAAGAALAGLALAGRRR